MERSHLRSLSKLQDSGGQESSSRDTSRPAAQARPVRPVASTGQTGQAKSRPRTFKPKRPEEGTRKVNEPKVQESFTKQKLTFAQLLNKYTKAVPKDRPIKKEPSSPSRQGKRSSPRGESSKRRGDSTIAFPSQKVYGTMSWVSPISGFSCPTWGHEGIWMYCYPMLYLPSHHREEDRRRHAFGKVSRPVHDRLGPHRSGQRRQPAPVRPVAIDRSDRSETPNPS